MTAVLQIAVALAVVAASGLATWAERRWRERRAARAAAAARYPLGAAYLRERDRQRWTA